MSFHREAILLKDSLLGLTTYSVISETWFCLRDAITVNYLDHRESFQYTVFEKHGDLKGGFKYVLLVDDF